MTRSPYIHHPLMLGFEQLERSLERAGKAGSDGYPPYNIEEMSDGKLRITLAVAGFSESDLAIQVEGNQLQIQGKQEDKEERVFLYKGIASRHFLRTFVLADGLEVEGAQLENGLLHIDLIRPQIDKQPKSIAISTQGKSSHKAQQITTVKKNQATKEKS